MISPLAYVDPSAKLGNNVTVHPFAYIDKNVEIGDNNVIMPYVSLMSGYIKVLLWQLFLRISATQVRIHLQELAITMLSGKMLSLREALMPVMIQ